jgi:hypothetical protein
MESRNDLDRDRFRLCFFSAFGTYIADTLSYPFELLATVIKSKHDRSPILATTRSLVHEHGIAGLFKGVSTVIWTTLFPNFTYFYVYESINNFAINRLKKSLNFEDNFYIPPLSSLCAEMVCVVLFVPFDTIQTRMQLNSPQYQYKGLFSGIMDVARHEGVLRLFSASYLYICQLLIFTPMQFTFYEWLKMSQFNVKEDKNLISYWESVKFTFISTSFSAIITNPINTLVVRYQVTDFTSSEGQSLSGWRLIKENVKKYGMRDLNRGMAIRLLQTNVNAMVFLPIYEMVRQLYGVDITK